MENLTNESKESSNDRQDITKPMNKDELPSEPLDYTEFEKEDINEIEDDYLKIPKLNLILLYIGLILTVFLPCLDGTVISTSLPHISAEFKSIDKISWIATAYLITYNAFKPLYGKFSDIFGRRATLNFAIFVFLIGSIGCSFAQTIDVLIVCRTIQGMGGSGMLALVFITIADIFPLEKRPKYQAFIWGTFGIASIIGPLVGGAFVDHLNWRWDFYINIPFCILAILSVTAFLKLPITITTLREKLARIDWLGSILIVGAIIPLLLATSWGGNTFDWISVPIISLYCTSVILFILFIWVESRWAVEPIAPKRLFKDASLISLFLTSFTSGTSFIVIIYFGPIYFQSIQGSSATESGIKMLPMLLCFVAASLISGALVIKTPGGFNTYIISGCALIVIGNGLISTLSDSTSHTQEIFYLSVLGIGFGFALQMVTLVGQGAVEKEDVAVITSLIGFTQTIGGAIGISISSALFNDYINRHLADIPAEFQTPEIIAIFTSITYITKLPEPLRSIAIDIYVNALQIVFRSCIVVSGVSFFTSLFIKRYEITTSPKDVAMV